VIVALVLACAAIDGDTIRCGSERIRLVAIDAPEMAGHCRKGRDCAPGDPVAARDNLEGLLYRAWQPHFGPVRLTIERLGTDHYGRTVADVYVKGLSLSCLQLASGNARYWPKYDTGGRIKRECGVGGTK
jgi:micrococcal nuclease